MLSWLSYSLSSSYHFDYIEAFLGYLSIFETLSHHSMSSSTRINELPVELVVDIFKSLNIIADATHLASTSKAFRAIWELNASAICGTVLQRHIPSYDQARELATAIIKRKADSTAPDNDSEEASYLESGINKQKLIVYLSRTVEMQVRLFEPASLPHNCWWTDSWLPDLAEYAGLDFSEIRQTKRARVVHLYYRIWILTVIPEPSAKEFLAAQELQEQQSLVIFAFRFIRIRLNAKWPWRASTADTLGTYVPRFDELYDDLAANYVDAVVHGRILPWWDRTNIDRFPLHEGFGIPEPGDWITELDNVRI